MIHVDFVSEKNLHTRVVSGRCRQNQCCVSDGVGVLGVQLLEALQQLDQIVSTASASG